MAVLIAGRDADLHVPCVRPGRGGGGVFVSACWWSSWRCELCTMLQFYYSTGPFLDLKHQCSP